MKKFSNIYVEAKELGQGPPVESPIGIFKLGSGREQLTKIADTILSVVNDLPDIDIDGRSEPSYIQNGGHTDTTSDDMQSIQIASNNQMLPISSFTKQCGFLFSTLLTLVVIPFCAKLIRTDKFVKGFQE